FQGCCYVRMSVIVFRYLQHNLPIQICMRNRLMTSTLISRQRPFRILHLNFTSFFCTCSYIFSIVNGISPPRKPLRPFGKSSQKYLKCKIWCGGTSFLLVLLDLTVVIDFAAWSL